MIDEPENSVPSMEPVLCEPALPRIFSVKRIFRIIAVILLFCFLAPILGIMAMRWLPPPTSSFMMRKQIAHLLHRSKTGVTYHWTSSAKIPRCVALAVVAAEDQKFPVHNGFDLEGIVEARERNKKGGRLRGGSSITQQVAKNLFLWPGKSYLRKGLEVYYTVLLELLWPKQRILDVYLNIAEFGDGIYGVGAAADKLLKKPTTAITRYDAAVLAAVLPSPKRLHADRPSAYVLERVAWIMGQMEMLGDGYLKSLK
jgi:monofunctional glycosyltransferase